MLQALSESNCRVGDTFMNKLAEKMFHIKVTAVTGAHI
jgi:hypothetical protein